MGIRIARREFLVGMGALAIGAVSRPAYAEAQSLTPNLDGNQPSPSGSTAKSGSAKSPFRVSVINDEISQDFGRACEVASREFGMEWIELRGMWNKNIVNLDAKELAEAQRILAKYELRVTDIASPLFKVDWPGAPLSKFSEHNDFHANFTFNQQDEVLRFLATG